ncbi:MAG: biotin carboxylase N-terminal domain-containing protein [Bacteroidales bacterium]
MILFKRILIANRGEIARRIIRTLKSLNIQSVAIFNDEDIDACYVKEADFKVYLPGKTLEKTYLNIENIIKAAKDILCDAIHPGYGFLSENSDFARECELNKITFIGPHYEAISVMGDKLAARKLAKEAGLNILEGVSGNISSILKRKQELEYPVLIKAAAGGGGKGMHIVYQESDLENALIQSSREAKAYFGKDDIYVEKYLDKPRHIEIQIVADKLNNIVHLFERECSMQRRYQKIIEETPAPGIDRDVINDLGKKAILLCKRVGYDNVGTVEFLMDRQNNFYFLEMNTRIQVEHAITEEVYGFDIVELQLCAAANLPINIKQENVVGRGHAIECRIYAEDPFQNFMPSPGKIWYYKSPDKNRFVRVDSSLCGPAKISGMFDPLISKLISIGHTRDEAIKNMEKSLSSYMIYGCKNNIQFLRLLIYHPDYLKGDISTAFCEDHYHRINKRCKEEYDFLSPCIPLISFLVFQLSQNDSAKKKRAKSIWNYIGENQRNKIFPMRLNGVDLDVRLLDYHNDEFLFLFHDNQLTAEKKSINKDAIQLRINDQIFDLKIVFEHPGKAILNFQGIEQVIERRDILLPNKKISSSKTNSQGVSGNIISPMPGKIVELKVKKGSKIKKGDALIVIESMKMENNIHAPFDSEVVEIKVSENDSVEANSILLTLKELNI